MKITDIWVNLRPKSALFCPIDMHFGAKLDKNEGKTCNILPKKLERNEKSANFAHVNIRPKTIPMEYRSLAPKEIESLLRQGCEATDWNDIQVADPFAVSQINNVRFTGCVYIAPDVTLRNIQDLGSTGHTSFANGTEVGVLKEDGGLEVIIYDELSSMEAAFEVQEARREPQLVAQMKQRAQFYARHIESDGSIIDEGAVITDVRQLTDVHIGRAAHVVGATRLVDVSVCSCPEAPSGVGDGAILEHVIISTDSHVGDGAQMDYCFVGQGCHIGRMYSAAQSLFFANCHFENGEACAYFAGPYSVSHHKATLMIACQTSFFNAGSGSNQSNHSYKMGPNKYGQLQRGAKLGSSSYVYWPMQVGVFCTVVGHHMGHQDLRDLPFSLITESGDGATVIIPGQAFRSVGTRRDAAKWPRRDKRSMGDGLRRDRINFTMLNPFTVGYIMRGMTLLRDMRAKSLTDYLGCHISKHHISKGIELYKQAINRYLGQVAERMQGVQGLQDSNPNADPLLPSTWHIEPGTGEGDWADYGGMLVPRAELLDALRRGESFDSLADRIDQWEWNWVCARFDMSDLDELIAKGHESEEAWNEALDADGDRDVEACDIEL